MNIEQIISHLFAARDAAHLLHLKTRSFAVHLALEELYESLLDAVDSFTEVYQGKHGILNIPPPDVKAFDTENAKQFIAQLVSFVESVTDSIDKESTIKNEWDSVKKTALKAKYKIDNLQ